jgi:transcriptional regulator of arginine metabolism
MNKAFRQGQILKLIRAKRILTQDDLARELKQSQGIDTTQVTLSRDVRELGLLKTPEGYRQVEAAAAGPDLGMVLGEFLQDVRAAQNLIVLRTSPGNANALAVALDNEDWPEIVGTIAGDDTVLIVAPDTDTASRLREKLLGLI